MIGATTLGVVDGHRLHLLLRSAVEFLSSHFA